MSDERTYKMLLSDIAGGGSGGGLPDYSEANDGDVLSIENGEPAWAAPGGGGGIVANMNTNTATLDKTWQEIYDAPFCIVKIEEEGVTFSFVVNKISQYTLSAYAYDGENLQFLNFATTAADGYPILQEPD